MKIKLTFLGAAKSVTGSRYLVETDTTRFLVDCGLYQERTLLERNWEPFPVPPDSVDAILLTHAHIDHSGYIPRFARDGFQKRIYCTSATADIVKVMLLDTGKIQEQDAEHKKKRHQREGRNGPHPDIPLYTAADAEACFPLFYPVPYKQRVTLANGVDFVLNDAGHVLGAAMIQVRVRQNGRETVLLFSGDIGRWNRPILHDPSIFAEADYIITESTYGDRVLPEPETVISEFIDIVGSTLRGGGKVVIPSFALERAQDVLYYLSQAFNSGRIPKVDVYLDSPMAVSITDIFEKHADLFDDDMKMLLKQKKSPFDFPGLKLTPTAEESKQIDRLDGPAIIIAGAGMANGGRIKYHLISTIEQPQNTILFVGYQAVGTLGRIIVDGAEEVRIHGQKYKIKARIAQLNGFSSHADANQILRWLNSVKKPPRRLFVTHGEEESANHLAEVVRQQAGWEVTVPNYLEEFELE